MDNFKFGRTYVQYNLGLLKDNQRMVFRIPVGDIPNEDINNYLRILRDKFNEPHQQVNLRDFDRDIFIPVRQDTPDITIIDHVSLLR